MRKRIELRHSCLGIAHMKRPSHCVTTLPRAKQCFATTTCTLRRSCMPSGAPFRAQGVKTKKQCNKYTETRIAEMKKVMPRTPPLVVNYHNQNWSTRLSMSPSVRLCPPQKGTSQQLAVLNHLLRWSAKATRSLNPQAGQKTFQISFPLRGGSEPVPRIIRPWSDHELVISHSPVR